VVGWTAVPGLIKAATVLTNKNLPSSFGVAYACYDYATDQHTAGTFTPAISNNIPGGAIVVGGAVRVLEAVTSNGSATLAIGTSAGSSSTALLAATAKATLVQYYKTMTVPAFTAATLLQTTAAGDVNFTIGTATLTAGKVEIWVFYFLAGGA
jgi:hypothetical protein